jgi:hypothetical protein
VYKRGSPTVGIEKGTTLSSVSWLGWVTHPMKSPSHEADTAEINSVTTPDLQTHSV